MIIGSIIPVGAAIGVGFAMMVSQYAFAMQRAYGFAGYAPGLIMTGAGILILTLFICLVRSWAHFCAGRPRTAAGFMIFPAIIVAVLSYAVLMFVAV